MRGTGHPHHLVVVQLARRSAHSEPPEPQLVAGLLLGEVVQPRASVPEVEGRDRRGRRVRLLVVGPAGAAQRTDQRRSEPGGPDRNRPPAGGEQAADQRHGVVLLGGGDLHLGRRADCASWPPRPPGRRARASSGTARRPGPGRSRPPPTTAREGPSRSGAGGVSASTGSPRSTASAMKRGVTDRGVAVSTKSGRHLAQTSVQGREGRHVQTARGPHHHPSAAGPCPAHAPP